MVQNKVSSSAAGQGGEEDLRGGGDRVPGVRQSGWGGRWGRWERHSGFGAKKYFWAQL